MKKTEYMRGELEDSYGILPLQDKILEIMVYIDGFCRRFDIKYSLMGGSALGAMRHGGFIPWDDDLDIFMDYENYEKFLAIASEHLDTERFYLQREDSAENPYFFSKVRMNGTTCISPVHDVGHQGIFVDIMCLNNAAPTALGRKMQFYAAGMLKAKACSRTKYRATGLKKKIQLFISKVVVVGPIKKLLLHIVRRHNKKNNSDTFAHLFGRAKYKNSFYPKKYFNGVRYVGFETVELPVMAGVEDYLRTRFGEHYMEMPDEKTRAEYQSHAGTWDTERDYKEYIEA